MNTYDLDELRRLWRVERITEEQAIGQLILHAQKIAQLVPEHEEQLTLLRRDVVDVEGEVNLLKRKNP